MDGQILAGVIPIGTAFAAVAITYFMDFIKNNIVLVSEEVRLLRKQNILMMEKSNLTRPIFNDANVKKYFRRTKPPGFITESLVKTFPIQVAPILYSLLQENTGVTHAEDQIKFFVLIFLAFLGVCWLFASWSGEDARKKALRANSETLTAKVVPTIHLIGVVIALVIFHSLLSPHGMVGK